MANNRASQDQQAPSMPQATPNELRQFTQDNWANLPNADIDPAFDLDGPSDLIANNNQIYPDFAAAPMLNPPRGMMGAVMPTPAPTPMTPYVPPMEPDASLGAHFHPLIGWYFPAIPAPAAALPNLPHVSDGYTRSLLTVPQQVPANNVSFAEPPKTKGKRRMKQGPQAFEAVQARARNGGVGRQGSDAEIEVVYTSKKKERDDRSNPAPKPYIADKPKAKASGIAQICTCNDKNQKKILRPKNCFMIYRQSKSMELQKICAGNNMKISKMTADMWNNETPAVKKYFKDLADQEAARHKAAHPNYSYNPYRKNQIRFGSENCVCGAYQANMAAKQQREAGEAQAAANGEEESDLEEWIPPTSPAKRRAPTAPMVPANIPNPSTMHFATPRQQAEAEAAYAQALKRGREAASLPDGDEEQPLSKRRSTRARNNISYAEPGEDDIYQPAETETLKRRPTQVTATEISPTVTEILGGPALNTRARSRSRSQSRTADLNYNVDFSQFYDFNGGFNPCFGDQSDYDYTFNFEDFINDEEPAPAPAPQEEDDNIVVTRGRRRNSSNSPGRRSTVAPSQLQLRRSSRNGRA